MKKMVFKMHTEGVMGKREESSAQDGENIVRASQLEDRVPVVQVEADHYFSSNYDTKERFCSYWHQIQESISLKPEKLLEIGIGNGFFSRYLKERGLNVVTLDIDKRLEPDVLGTILDLPFADESFDVVACYELLEHLPFNDFLKALQAIFRVSSAFALLSTRDIGKVYRFDIEIPLIGEIKRLIPLPRLRKPAHSFDGQHYWEIGKAGYSLQRVMMEMQNTGFQIVRTYRVFEQYRHRFFVLRKGKDKALT